MQIGPRARDKHKVREATSPWTPVVALSADKCTSVHFRFTFTFCSTFSCAQCEMNMEMSDHCKCPPTCISIVACDLCRMDIFWHHEHLIYEGRTLSIFGRSRLPPIFFINQARRLAGMTPLSAGSATKSILYLNQCHFGWQMILKIIGIYRTYKI